MSLAPFLLAAAAAIIAVVTILGFNDAILPAIVIAAGAIAMAVSSVPKKR